MNSTGVLAREAPERVEFLQSVREMVGDGIDIYCIPETWLRGDIPLLPGLRRSFGAPRGGGRGGVAQLVADGLDGQVKVWKARPADGVLWLRYSKIPGLSEDLLVATCYLPPNQRPLALKNWLETLEIEVEEALAVGLVLLAGDFNC